MRQRLVISGTGCSLADYLYTGIDFAGDAFRRLSSRSPGDGGLVTGGLVFGEEVERYSGIPVEAVLRSLAGGRNPDAVNLGGPAVVALCACSQILSGEEVSVGFAGASGEDDPGRFTRDAARRSGIAEARFKILPERSPVTYVLSDENASGGQGERSFINILGAAAQFGPEDLEPSFFRADLLLFGGTAIVPRLHDALTELLERSKENGSSTVVATVYDFRNERLSPRERWPLGSSDESYRNIDLLITDREEALRLSGSEEIDRAVDFFGRRGVGACLVTNGAGEITLFSRGSLFAPATLRMPVSAEVARRLETASAPRDTTGCGDNFAGGVLAGVALQLLHSPAERLDLASACALGIVSGGLACFYLGGAYVEKAPGEKRSAVAELYAAYARQVAQQLSLLPGESLFRAMSPRMDAAG